MTRLEGRISPRAYVNVSDSSLLYCRATSGVLQMPDYRLYYLEQDGHIGLADWIEAADDDAAVAKARRVRPETHCCEVWRHKRLVATLDHTGRAKHPAHS